MQESKEQRVHRTFEKISNKYDLMNSVISFQRHIAWRNKTMELMDVHLGAKALDLCCGTADWTIALARAVSTEGHVIGLDFSENMLSVGQQKIDELQLTQVELLHGNAMKLPFEENSFDYVTIGFGLRNVPDYMQVLAEMYRVLKPGGMAVCLETSQPEQPVVRQAFSLYFRYLMPLIGKLVAKSYEEYSWLQESAKDFPRMNELANMFRDAGFSRVEVKPHTFGVAATHIGYKDMPSS